MSDPMRRPRLVLGSASPRRLQLLAQIGITPDIVQPADINEAVEKAELPRPYVQRVAAAKCCALKLLFPNDFILTADTTVRLGRRIFGKPETIEEARDFLTQFSGRRHRVLTAMALLAPAQEIPIIKVSETTVKIARLHPTDIEHFLASDEWRGKAGGYNIQSSFAKHIVWIQGSQASVMGLDVHQAWGLLIGNGWRPTAP